MGILKILLAVGVFALASHSIYMEWRVHHQDETCEVKNPQDGVSRQQLWDQFKLAEAEQNRIQKLLEIDGCFVGIGNRTLYCPQVMGDKWRMR